MVLVFTIYRTQFNKVKVSKTILASILSFILKKKCCSNYFETKSNISSANKWSQKLCGHSVPFKQNLKAKEVNYPGKLSNHSNEMLLINDRMDHCLNIIKCGYLLKWPIHLVDLQLDLPSCSVLPATATNIAEAIIVSKQIHILTF